MTRFALDLMILGWRASDVPARRYAFTVGKVILLGILVIESFNYGGDLAEMFGLYHPA